MYWLVIYSFIVLSLFWRITTLVIGLQTTIKTPRRTSDLQAHTHADVHTRIILEAQFRFHAKFGQCEHLKLKVNPTLGSPISNLVQLVV